MLLRRLTFQNRQRAMGSHVGAAYFQRGGCTAMINQSTLDSLKAMRLTAMAAELERQLEDAATLSDPWI